jgi:hypothetical protein
MFAQFAITSFSLEVIYDPVGKYYGSLLYGAIGLTLLFSGQAFYNFVSLTLVAVSAASFFSRLLYCHYSGKKILFRFSSTPLTISRRASTSEGGIVGWSYEAPVPVVHNLRKMPDSIKTPIPNVLQTSQWVYSPAGIPTAILTGWLAAQAAMKSKS